MFFVFSIAWQQHISVENDKMHLTLQLIIYFPSLTDDSATAQVSKIKSMRD